MDTVKLRKLVVHAYKSYIKYRTFCTLSVITVLILGLGFSQRANLPFHFELDFLKCLSYETMNVFVSEMYSLSLMIWRVR